MGGSGGGEQAGLFSTRRPVVHISFDLGMALELIFVGVGVGRVLRQLRCRGVSAGECVEWMSVKLESFLMLFG